MDTLSNMDMGWYDMGLNFQLFLRPSLSPHLVFIPTGNMAPSANDKRDTT